MSSILRKKKLLDATQLKEWTGGAGGWLVGWIETTSVKRLLLGFCEPI